MSRSKLTGQSAETGGRAGSQEERNSSRRKTVIDWIGKIRNLILVRSSASGWTNRSKWT